MFDDFIASKLMGQTSFQVLKQIDQIIVSNLRKSNDHIVFTAHHRLSHTSRLTPASQVIPLC
jgi:hypothetical protein